MALLEALVLLLSEIRKHGRVDRVPFSQDDAFQFRTQENESRYFLFQALLMVGLLVKIKQWLLLDEFST